MLGNSFTLSDFGRGITIPIPKGERNEWYTCNCFFRGITLSPVDVKIFEHCILMLFSDLLQTSINQFGFKPKVGCAHAIFTVRKVVNYYVNNG